MATLIENVNRIYTDKENIKQAIISKGITVPDGTSLDDYADLISQIEEGADLSGVTATASDVLNGKVIVDSSGNEVTGTMANKGAVSGTISTSGGTYTIPAGYHNGSGKVTGATLATLVGSNVTLTSNASLLSGVTAYGKNGTKYTGSITSKSAATYTPSTSNQTISSGQYLSGTQTIKGDSNLVSENIVSGKSIFGVEGSAVVYDKYLKPLHNFIERKPYLVRKGTSNGSTGTTTLPESYYIDDITDDNKFKMNYGLHETGWIESFCSTSSSSSDGLESSGGTTTTTIYGYSKEYFDNYIPKFNGYYVECINEDSTRKLATLEFSYSSNILDGLSSAGIDTSIGTQFYNTATVNTTSSSIGSMSTDTYEYYHRILKLSEDYGLIVYYAIAISTGIKTTQNVRLFRVARDGTITVWAAVAVSSAESSTTIRNLIIGSSLRTSNQVFVLVSSLNTSTDVTTYSYEQLSCNAVYTGATKNTGMSRVRTTNSSGTAINVSLGNTGTYSYCNILDSNEFPNDLGVVTLDSSSVIEHTYFGDNCSNALKGTPNKTFQELLDDGYLVLTGDWFNYYTESYSSVGGSTDLIYYYCKAYLKGIKPDGSFVIRTELKQYDTYTSEETITEEKDCIAKFETNGVNLFYEVTE